MHKIKHKFYIIRNIPPDLCEDGSYYSLVADKNRGIQQIMARSKVDKKPVVQSWLFDRSNFTLDKAREYVKARRTSNIDRLNSKKLLIAAKPALCHAPASDEKPNLMTPEVAKTLYDKYYLNCPFVHEGFNANGCYFYENELREHYETANGVPIDWEHNFDQIIGVHTNAALKEHPEKPLAITIGGILWRLSPFMMAEERTADNKVLTRDKIIQDRYYAGELAMSMECIFDSIKCTKCGYESQDWLDFEIHKMIEHWLDLDSGEKIGYGPIGVSFTGSGIVAHPADDEAVVMSLRTSDDGTIQELALSASANDSNPVLLNQAFSRMVANLEPHDRLVAGKNTLFASETKNNIEKTTKKDANNDNRTNGGSIMFELTKKLAACQSLSEVFATAQRVLKDFQGDKALDAEAAEAYASELAEFVQAFISKAEFRVTDIYTLTEASKLEAIEAARNEEKATAAAAVAAKESEITTIKAEIDTLKADIATKDEKIKTFETEKADRVLDDKINGFIVDVKQAGVQLDEVFEATVREMAKNIIDDPEKLTSFKTSMIASVAKGILTSSSENGGGTSHSSDDNSSKSLFDKLNSIGKE